MRNLLLGVLVFSSTSTLAWDMNFEPYGEFELTFQDGIVMCTTDKMVIPDEGTPADARQLKVLCDEYLGNRIRLPSPNDGYQCTIQIGR